MLQLLKNENDVNISMSALRRHLKCLGPYRRKAESDVLDVAALPQDLDFEENPTNQCHALQFPGFPGNTYVCFINNHQILC